MNCTQKQQLVCFPKVRVYKPWFRHFNDHKDFRNEGTVHLFSLMALFSYANFRSNERVIYGDRYMEAPGQWICKLGALPRILRVHSKAQALELMEYFRNHGFLTFEILDEEKEILRFTIADWKEHCTHLQYNYYSYKGSGFFFFPLPVGRLLLKTARKEVGIVFSELDAIIDMWLHTILNDPQVRGSEYMPVVYYSNMRGMPLLSYTYLARRWGWSKSRVGRFMLKAGEYGIISRVSFSSSRGSVISMCRYHHTTHILEMGETRFRKDYCKWAEKKGYRNCERMAVLIFATAQNGIPVLPNAPSTQIVITEAIRVLHTVEASRDAILTQMQALAKTLPEYSLVREMPCIGDTLAPRLIAEIGDVRRFHSKRALIAYAGIDAPPYQSGKFCANNRHISKRGNRYLRKTGYEVMQSYVMHKPANDPIFTFIEKKRGEGKSGKLAMVAGLNKFLRVYYGKVTELYRSLPAIE